MSGLSQSWEEARLCRTPGPAGSHKGPDLSERPRLGALQQCTPGSSLGLGRMRGTPNSSEPHSHPGPGDSSRGRSLESDRPGLCEQLFKGSLLLRALRRRLL